MDKIYIRDLTVVCIIGVDPRERSRKQQVVLNVTLECDLSKAGKSDSIQDTVDYKVIKDRIVHYVENSRHLLLERMADQAAEICLEFKGVHGVTVTVDKPGVLAHARSVAVEIYRTRETQGARHG